MSPKKIVGLLIVLGVLLAIYTAPNKNEKAQLSVKKLEPGTRPFEKVDINQAATVKITKGPGEPVELTRKEGEWVVASRYEYPADFQQLAYVLKQIPDLEVGQTVPHGETFLEELGLEGSNTIQIVLQDEQGGTLLDLSLGETRHVAGSGAQQYSTEHYARIGKGAPFLLDKRFDVNWRPDAWLFKKLLDVQAGSLKRITLRHGDERIVLEPSDKGDFQLTGLSEGEMPKQNEVNRVGRALQTLYLVSIANPLFDTDTFGFDSGSVYEALAHDGRLYRVEVGGEAEQGRYVRFSFGVQQGPEPTESDAFLMVMEEEEAKGETYTEEKRTARVAEVFKEMKAAYSSGYKKALADLEDLKAMENWVYIVANYQADTFKLERSDLVQKGAIGGSELNTPPAAAFPGGGVE